MNDPALYSKCSSFQKRDAYNLFLEFSTYPGNSFKKCNKLLDIGCGPGDTLVNSVLCQLNPQPSKVVGIDASHEMIEVANKTYKNETLSFQVLNLQDESFNEILNRECFDLVTSFYCYQFIRNEKYGWIYILGWLFTISFNSQALSNIFNVIKPGGSLFMIFPVKYCFFDVCDELVKENKYQEYLKHLIDFVNPYYYDEAPTECMKLRLEKAGFKVQHLELRELSYTFESSEYLKGKPR